MRIDGVVGIASIIAAIALGCASASRPAPTTTLAQDQAVEPNAASIPSARPEVPTTEQLDGVIIVKGFRSLGAQRQTWDMRLPIKWTLSTREGGARRIEQQVVSDWTETLAPTDSPSSRAYAMTFTEAIDIGPDGIVTDATLAPDAQDTVQKLDVHLRSLSRKPRSLGPLASAQAVRSVWAPLLSAFALPSLAKRQQEPLRRVARFRLSGDNPVEVVETLAKEQSPCSTRGTCSRYRMDGKADAAALRAGYQQSQGRSDLTDAADDFTAWLDVSDAGQSPAEIGTRRQTKEVYQEKGREVAVALEDEVRIELRPSP